MIDGFLTMAEVAHELNVQAATISQWRGLSKPGKRYASNPFPAADHMVGPMPLWKRERLPEMRAWIASRAGRGAGGGRPRKNIADRD